MTSSAFSALGLLTHRETARLRTQALVLCSTREPANDDLGCFGRHKIKAGSFKVREVR